MSDANAQDGGPLGYQFTAFAVADISVTTPWSA